MIDQFSREQFEDALPPGFRHAGLVKGEHTYTLETGDGVALFVRSSVRSDGQAAGVGEDSIRLYFLTEEGKPLGGKLTNYVTRVPGWAKRLDKAVLKMLEWRRL